MITAKKLSVVVACMDYRFWPQALPLLQKKYGAFDLIEIAGASKNLVSPIEPEDKTTLLENITLSLKLHHPTRLVLTNHFDCGAYGGSEHFRSREAEIAFHQEELAKAKTIAQKAFPNVPVATEFLLADIKGKVTLL